MFFASVSVAMLAAFDLHQIVANNNSVLMGAYIGFASENAIHKKLSYREKEIYVLWEQSLEEGRELRYPLRSGKYSGSFTFLLHKSIGYSRGGL